MQSEKTNQCENSLLMSEFALQFLDFRGKILHATQYYKTLKHSQIEAEIEKETSSVAFSMISILVLRLFHVTICCCEVPFSQQYTKVIPQTCQPVNVYLLL